MHADEVVRILDATLNRASEGLRVVEDYVRFVLDDRHLTEQFKQFRHDLAAAGAVLPLGERYAARDTLADVGTTVTTVAEGARSDAWIVCVASLERLKQSLRSLEEYSKVESATAATQFEALRYRLYTLEAAVGRICDSLDRLADVRLYVLVDGRASAQEFEKLVRELLAASVDAIQLRDKQLSDRELIARAELLRNLVHTTYPAPSPLWGGLGRGAKAGARRDHPSLALPNTGREQEVSERKRPLLIINDRPDIAAVVGADGVHLGQDDMTVKDARQIVGPRMLIGVSTHSIEQARGVVLAGANYLGVGPTFPSHTKQFDAFPGLELVSAVAREIKLPAFAIGGITLENVTQVVAAGLDRIAVATAITGSPQPVAAAVALRHALQSAPSPWATERPVHGFRDLMS